MALDWPRVRRNLDEALELSRELSEKVPDLAAELDQQRALLRDALDDSGLSITDETVVYAGVLFAGMVTYVGELLYRHGLLEGESDASKANLVGGGLAVLLAPYAPAEARS